MNFYITLLFGWSGLHKFMQKNYKAGFLYLFTCGLFGVGWVIDVFKCIRNRKAPGSYDPTVDDLVDSVCMSIDPELAKIALPCIRDGVSYKQIERIFSDSHPDSECDDLFNRIAYLGSYHSSMHELHSLSEANISKYIVLCADDDQLCSVCRKMKGKKFQVSSAKIGYNCPPFHRGCRCNIIADLD